MNRLAAIIAVVATLWAAPALAADPTGDWTGTLRTPTGALQLGLEVRRDAKGAYQASYDDLSQNYRGLQMQPAGPGTPPPFKIKSPYGTMTYVWNPARGGWDGVWREKGGAYPIALARGTIPPITGLSPVDRIVLTVIGGVMLLEAAAIARLLQLRRRRRLRLRPA